MPVLNKEINYDNYMKSVFIVINAEMIKDDALNEGNWKGKFFEQ